MSLNYARVINSDRRDHVVNAALEYYDTFHCGFQSRRLSEIFRYLDTRIDQDLFMYGLTGMDTDGWIEQWRRYTRLFPPISIRVKATTCSYFEDPSDVTISLSFDARTTTSCIVEARGMLNGVISLEAVATLVPHIMFRDDLVQKLVNQPLVCPMQLVFYNNSAGRIVRLDFHADFFDTFHHVPGLSLIDITHIMDEAAIGENCTVPPVIELAHLNINEQDAG